MLMGTVLVYHQACQWLLPALPQPVILSLESQDHSGWERSLSSSGPAVGLALPRVPGLMLQPAGFELRGANGETSRCEVTELILQTSAATWK